MPQSRRVLLWIMLGSLGAAAAAAVLAVLAPGTEAVDRVISMAIATAISCGLAMTSARYLEKPEQRLAAMVAIGLILVEYLLFLALIWGIAENFLPMRRAQEAPGMSMAFIAVTGIPIVWMFRLIFSESTRVAGWAGVVLFGAALLTLLVAAWWNFGFRDQGDVVGAGFSVEAFTFPVIACLVGLGTGERRRWFRWFGVAGAILGGAILFSGAIHDADVTNDLTFVVAAVIAVLVSHLNLSLRAPLPSGTRWLRWASTAAVVATGSLMIFYTLNVQSHRNRYDEDLLDRLLAAGSICTACGWIAMVIIVRMNRKAERVMIAPADLHEIQVQCPGCQAKQTLPLGESRCGECGLRFLIKVDEPRCETCGYLLYRLKSDRCPECGTAVGNARNPNGQSVQMTNVQ